MANKIIKKYKVTKKGLGGTIDRLADDLLPFVANGTIINGGNFQIREGIYKTHYLATATFEAATLLYKKSKTKNKKVTLSFLIDNFSIRNKGFKMPKEYLKIQKKYNINPKKILYFKENQLRNRAARILLKQLTKKEVNQGSIFIKSKLPKQKFEVARIHKMLKIFTPLGTALLAQQLFDSEKQGNKVAVNLMHEGSYESKGGANAFVYHLLGGKMKVLNVYFREKAKKIEIEVTFHDK
ncbi:MAG: hypothetical protein WC675_04385 [Patescibacteria group bacterium]|jgi:hypothetical protein